VTKVFIHWYMADGSQLEQTIEGGHVTQETQTAKPKAYVQSLGDIIQQVADYPVQSVAQDADTKVATTKVVHKKKPKK
jgi:hypothetical protein